MRDIFGKNNIVMMSYDVIESVNASIDKQYHFALKITAERAIEDEQNRSMS